MTEITIESRKLAPAVERFVLHWGDMGNQWGVNRSVAQIHALALSLRAAADRGGHCRDARHGALQRLQQPQGADRLEADPAGAGDGRPARPFRGRDRPARNGHPHRPGPQGARDRSRRRRAARLRGRGRRRPKGKPGRPRAAGRDAGLRRDAEPLVRPDARCAAGQDHGADPDGRQGRRASSASARRERRGKAATDRFLPVSFSLYRNNRPEGRGET